jgi:hypothetical protein
MRTNVRPAASCRNGRLPEWQFQLPGGVAGTRAAGPGCGAAGCSPPGGVQAAQNRPCPQTALACVLRPSAGGKPQLGTPLPVRPVAGPPSAIAGWLLGVPANASSPGLPPGCCLHRVAYPSPYSPARGPCRGRYAGSTSSRYGMPGRQRQ